MNPQAPDPAHPALARPRYLASTLAAAGMAFLAGHRHSGFLLLFLVPGFLLWLAVAYLATRIRQASRKPLLGHLGIWCSAFLVVGAVHYQRAAAARQGAEQALSAVLAYQRQHGRYPDNLAEAGIDAAMVRRWRLVYGLDGQQPDLRYWGTFALRSVYTYDFATGHWRYRVD